MSGTRNAYNEDSAVSWTDWSADPEADMLTRFVSSVLQLRAKTPAVRRARFSNGVPPPTEPCEHSGLVWYTPAASPMPDWDATWAHAFAVVYPGEGADGSLLVLFNAYWDVVDFVLPAAVRPWQVVIDTAHTPAVVGPVAAAASYAVGARSCVVLTG